MGETRGSAGAIACRVPDVVSQSPHGLTIGDCLSGPRIMEWQVQFMSSSKVKPIMVLTSERWTKVDRIVSSPQLYQKETQKKYGGMNQYFRRIAPFSILKLLSNHVQLQIRVAAVAAESLLP